MTLSIYHAVTDQRKNERKEAKMSDSDIYARIGEVILMIISGIATALFTMASWIYRRELKQIDTRMRRIEESLDKLEDRLYRRVESD